MIEAYALIAAIFSGIATGLAAYATWQSPLAAAKLAETMRREAEQAERRHANKMELFTTLMQERAAIYSESGVRALNLIDVVFNESREVRDAWAELLLSFDPSSNTPPAVQQERLRRLLGVMAKDIGLTDQLRTDDLGRVYFPNALQEERLIKDIQRRQIIKQLLESQGGATTNTALPPPPNPWPPKPQ